jgi:hypothetical protein
MGHEESGNLARPAQFPGSLARDAASPFGYCLEAILPNRFATDVTPTVRTSFARLRRTERLLFACLAHPTDGVIGLTRAHLLGGVRVPEAPAHAL